MAARCFLGSTLLKAIVAEALSSVFSYCDPIPFVAPLSQSFVFALAVRRIETQLRAREKGTGVEEEKKGDGKKV